MVGDANDLVGSLTIELEIELGFGSPLVPIGKRFQLAASQRPLRQRSALDGNAYAGGLPGDTRLLCQRLSRGNDASGDQPRPALGLACEKEDCVAWGDVLAAIHRLL